MTQAAQNRNNPQDMYRSTSGILLNSRTVVEKKEFVSTGILTYAEGDILEIEISDYKKFELGDSVKMTVYSPGGIYTFHSTVVAKDQGALMVINPPQNQKRFAEKRESPRVDVEHSGQLLSIHYADSGEQELEERLRLDIRNVSVSGVGFLMEGGKRLEESATADVMLDLGFDITCRVEIIRSEPEETGIYYGAKYVEMPVEKANALRAFIIKKQVEQHFSFKQSVKMRRMFK
ncbi:PilZ domain-containing protein [Paenibacillus sp. UNCCL117]|uniref:PilZ domain-containing protein n=1 Tax=unclassified Paenibacillus TaxID=185978 RepID=UPI00087FE61D|nr:MULTISPECIES: PilZ domain-containing protein [unclassified Paenibacillus]SDE32974.1 PilZ domain-containing protein [Paenibacillus sp. cl123]SFW63921.1 PilZ domain-containing protein [Paenibacillus sp. UNCCL117]